MAKLKCKRHKSANCGLGCRKPSRSRRVDVSASDYGWFNGLGFEVSQPSGTSDYGDSGYSGGSDSGSSSGGSSDSGSW